MKARQLNPTQREQPLESSGKTLTVAGLIRLSAQHSVWHAGQIALTQLD
jgi:hypothetical protein